MDRPKTDTSEYAALLDFMATGGRDQSSLKPTQDPQVLTRYALQRRARAVTQGMLAIARLRARKRR